jgi:hypothetical protein
VSRRAAGGAFRWQGVNGSDGGTGARLGEMRARCDGCRFGGREQIWPQSWAHDALAGCRVEACHNMLRPSELCIFTRGPWSARVIGDDTVQETWLRKSGFLRAHFYRRQNISPADDATRVTGFQATRVTCRASKENYDIASILFQRPPLSRTSFSPVIPST